MTEYKCVVLGCSGVGKSALTIQFIQGVFVENYDTTIEDSYRKRAKLGEEDCLLSILDTAEYEHQSSRDQNIRFGEGFVILYAIDSRPSFEEISVIHQLIHTVKSVEKVPIVVAGNKCDLEDFRKVSKEEAAALCKRLDVPFYETSALARTNVDEVFHACGKEIQKKYAPQLDGSAKASTNAKKRSCEIL
eukprot:TRINITY_DN7001_c0_g2_i4.p1 TRINITY_DN7001_c0_g2~~TRINITY_DN7001_c0_g2_i4.p1  ORF type:complete len:190 (-),score=38.08 TRINITY_DN7001_c0_g2_i4:138-707(-)